MQSIVRAIYPPQCVACDAATADDHGLCGACWRETHFITGIVCDRCGTPLLDGGDENAPQTAPDLLCDDCMKIARPWAHGRAVFLYSGVGRRLVLGLKHGDRTDLVPAAAAWMHNAGGALIADADVIVPVPIHWTRLVKRRYNQAALLAHRLARDTGKPVLADGLVRMKRTAMLDGHNRADRFAALSGAISAKPNRVPLFRGRRVLIVDDVMTSGATLAAATEAAHAAGAQQVCILTLARVGKDA